MEDFEYIEKQKNISLMQSIGSLPCKKCGDRCLPDIYIGDWVCQKCGTRYTLDNMED